MTLTPGRRLKISMVSWNDALAACFPSDASELPTDRCSWAIGSGGRIRALRKRLGEVAEETPTAKSADALVAVADDGIGEFAGIAPVCIQNDRQRKSLLFCGELGRQFILENCATVKDMGLVSSGDDDRRATRIVIQIR